MVVSINSTQYIYIPSHPNISNYNLSYNANMGYDKYQTQFSTDTSTWYYIPQVSSYIVHYSVTCPTGNPGYSAHIVGLTTTSPIIQYAYMSYQMQMKILTPSPT